MAKKDFSALLNHSQSQKRATNLESENERLRDKLKVLENSKNSDSSNSNINSNFDKLKLSEIKLTSNIRDDYQYEQIESLSTDIIERGQLQPVLVTRDNYLLAGYRRFHAIKLLNENPQLFSLPDHMDRIPNTLICYRIASNFSDLTEQQIEELQYSENVQRKSIDHFHISNLFNKYLKKGYELNDICEIFKKNKGYISAVISLKNIDEVLIKWLKEFQVYAWSQNKYELVAKKGLSDTEKNYLEKNKGILGWKPLYEIGKQPDIDSQKQTFIRLYQNRLTDEEINSDYFAQTSVDKISDKRNITVAIKHAKMLGHAIKKINQNLDSQSGRNITEKVNKHITKIEYLLDELSTLG